MFGFPPTWSVMEVWEEAEPWVPWSMLVEPGTLCSAASSLPLSSALQSLWPCLTSQGRQLRIQILMTLTLHPLPASALPSSSEKWKQNPLHLLSVGITRDKWDFCTTQFISSHTRLNLPERNPGYSDTRPSPNAASKKETFKRKERDRSVAQV